MDQNQQAKTNAETTTVFSPQELRTLEKLIKDGKKGQKSSSTAHHTYHR